MYQLIYVSTATRPMDETELSELLQQSRRNNQRHLITGLLLYLDGTFMQVIEGEEEKVQTLISNIIHDRRNKDVRIIHEGEIPARHFYDWSMGFVNLSLEKLSKMDGFASIKNPEDFRTLMTRQEGLALHLLQGFYTMTVQPDRFGGNPEKS